MEYVRDHGTFADLPYDRIYSEFRRCYPSIFALNQTRGDQAFRHEFREFREFRGQYINFS